MHQNNLIMIFKTKLKYKDNDNDHNKKNDNIINLKKYINNLDKDKKYLPSKIINSVNNQNIYIKYIC